MKKSFFLEYRPFGINWFWIGAKKVPGSGFPGTWKWLDGSDVDLTSK